VLNLKPNQQRYSQLLAEDGGILDDLMVTRVGAPGHEGWLYLVVNASMKDQDYAHIAARLPRGVTLNRRDGLGLMALQGPSAAAVLARLGCGRRPRFMKTRVRDRRVWRHVSRSGYTARTGSRSPARTGCVALWPRSSPIGGEAHRASARGIPAPGGGPLPLRPRHRHHHVSPSRPALIWSIQKRRREEGGFPGATASRRDQGRPGPRARRPQARRPRPAREGAIIATPEGREVGIVTSGGFGPTVNGPVAMGYVARENASPGNEVLLIVRGKPMPAKVAPMPFAPHRYKR
jgi:aminomethyltransferase